MATIVTLRAVRAGAWAAAVLFSAVPAPAQSIVSVEDTLYSEVHFLGSTSNRTHFHLGPDGVARKLFDRGYGPGTEYKVVYTGSEQLSYVYTPASAATPFEATLEFTGGVTTQNGVRHLFFSGGPKRGSLGGTASFSFATRTTLTGALNISNRFWLRPGQTTITGFVLDDWRTVLVRGVGPSLQKMGVPNVVADPAIALYWKSSLSNTNDQWGVNGPDAQAMSWIFELVGAFPYDAGAADAALFVEAEPGIHTIHATAAGATAEAEMLVEMYVLPYE